MTAKKWYLSKTIWFNAVSAFVLILTELQTVLSALPVESANVDLIQQWLPMFVVLGNAWLRVITDKAVAW